MSDIYNYFFEDEDKDNKEEDDEDIIIGIDLGTTNSAVSIIKNNRYEIIPDEYGNHTIPSIVSFTNVSKYVGNDAKNQLDINPENSYYEVKRLIGRNYTDTSVQNDLPFFTFDVGNDKEDNILLKSNLNKRKKNITPEEISANILKKLKNMAEDHLGKNIHKAVITVPAYFNDSQRQATKDASTIAGLECVRIINEPTAAALMYGLEKKTVNNKEDTNVLVYDFGGGTLDASLLSISDGVFEVLASTGNTHLGGADFDNTLVTYCENVFMNKHGLSKLKNLSVLSKQKLRKSCERAKKILSQSTSTIIGVKDYYDGKNLFIKITRDMFNKLCRDLFILSLKCVEDVLVSADLNKSDVDEIILVGGATRMPMVQDNLKMYFGKTPSCSVDPDEVVAAGAAIQAHILSHNDDPFSNCVVLLDIIPLSLGVNVIGGEMNIILPRNQRIPTKKTKKYTTDSDNQTSVTIEIYEGERKLTKNNFKIGEFNLSGIEPAPRGYAEIEITFNIDINGIVTVKAKDKKNEENENSIIIKCNNSRLTQEDINDLIREADDMDTEDKLVRKKKRLYYEIDNLCSNITYNMNDENCNLKDKDKKILSNEISVIKEWLKETLFDKREVEDYKKLLTKLRKRFGVLIFKSSNEMENVEGQKADNTNCTDVFDDEEDDEDGIFEKLYDEEIGLKDDDNEDDKIQIKNCRNHIVDLCHSIFDIISYEEININNDDKGKLKDYIDDVLVWVYVKTKITIAEYNDKINDINNYCNNILIECTNVINDDYKSKRKDLEDLVYMIKSTLDNNVFSSDDKNVIKLNNIILNILDWLLYTEVEIEKNKLIIDDNEYQTRIDQINNLCDNVYKSILLINDDGDKDDISIIDSVENKISGTSIASLRTKKIDN